MPGKATRIGVAAHITAAAPGGPRFDVSLNPEERRSIKNGIWLCQTCARLIDADPQRYTVFRLLGWKEDAEQAALQEMEGRKPREPEESKHKEGWHCPFCDSLVGDRQHVCLGCHAEIVYGATRLEREDAAKVGLMLGGVLSFLLFVALPGWMESYLAWPIPVGLGLGRYAFPVAGGLLVAFAYGAVQVEEISHRKNPPRFFRPMLS